MNINIANREVANQITILFDIPMINQITRLVPNHGLYFINGPVGLTVDDNSIEAKTISLNYRCKPLDKCILGNGFDSQTNEKSFFTYLEDDIVAVIRHLSTLPKPIYLYSIIFNNAETKVRGSFSE